MQKFFVTIKCPYCKNTQQKSLKKWKFGDFDVDRLQCKSCKKKFNYYYSSKSSWTNPKPK